MKTKTSYTPGGLSWFSLSAVIMLTALTGCDTSTSSPTETPEAAPVVSKPAVEPASEPSNPPPLDTTVEVGDIQTLQITLVSSTEVTTVDTNVTASKNPDGSVNITIATADGRKINGTVGAEVISYLCSDGYSFSAYKYYPAVPSGGVFPTFKDSNSETVTLANNAFTDQHAGCDVTKFQLTGGNMHGNLKISGSPSFAV